MFVPVMAISNLVLIRQIYSEETNGAHAFYREPVPLSRWQKFWSKRKSKKLAPQAPFASAKGASSYWALGHVSWEKMLKSGAPRTYFQDCVAKIRVFEQNIDITKFWRFYSATVHEYSIFVIFLKRFCLAMKISMFFKQQMNQ